MKKVHKPDMVAHLWANRSQDEARNAQGNFYFKGPTLYSYGSHYVCGHFMPEAYSVDGRPLVLVNANTYSNTTARHMAMTERALHGVVRVYVPGMDSSVVHSRWARPAAETLIKAMRAAAIEAATSRRVKPETRARHVREAQTHAANARHILRVSAARRDLDGEARKLARSLSLAIPADTAFPDWECCDDPKEYAARCVALAQVIGRDMARESLRVTLANMGNTLDKLAEYPAPDGAWNRIRTAAKAVNAIETASQMMREAEESAKLGRARIPADFRRRLELQRARLPELTAAAAQDARADNLRFFAGRLDVLRENVGEDADWIFRRAMEEAREYADRLATLDTESERDARREELDVLQAKRDQWAAASAPDRVKQFLLFAEDDEQAGRFTQAYTAIRNAYRAAQDGGLPDANITAAAERIKATEAAAQSARIEAWRNGASVSVPRGDSPMLRLVGERIETSWGADVPATVARNLWRLVCAARASRAAMIPDGAHRVGAFTLDRVEANGDLVIGCHTLTFAELQRMAVTLGYITETEATA